MGCRETTNHFLDCLRLLVVMALVNDAAVPVDAFEIIYLPLLYSNFLCSLVGGEMSKLLQRRYLR